MLEHDAQCAEFGYRRQARPAYNPKRSWIDSPSAPGGLCAPSFRLCSVFQHIDVVMKDGAPGRVLVCAFFEFRGGKAAKMTEIAHFEGVQLHLDNH
jgi:hypothetical protein